MPSDFEIVEVWACRFTDRAAFEEYVREMPRDDIEEPLSEFISDQGRPWYDHDLFGAAFHDEPSADIEKLLRAGHAFASSYAPTAAAVARQRGLDECNATITLWGENSWDPRTVRRRAYHVEYLGRFPCDPDAK